MNHASAPQQTGPTVAVLFDRLGPYHCSRLRAVARRTDAVAIEFCGETREYAWDPVATGDIPRVTLFPGQSSASVSNRACWQKLSTTLDTLSPSCLAVPGWGTPFALSALSWCRKRGRPAVIMSESTAWDEPRRPWKELLKRRIVQNATAGLVGGRPHAEYLASLGIPPEHIFLGYDAIDNAYFEDQAKAVRASGGAFRAALGLPEKYFLASNRFVAKKNLPALIQAYAAYRDQIGSGAWSLVLLGDGPGRASLVAQIAALNLQSYVQMPGFKQYADLPAYYALAAGFVHASTTEQWGLVVNEAMACGLPVLVSDRCGCARDLVNGNGWTFDPNDVHALSSALRKLTELPEDERLALGDRSRELIAAWSPDRFGDGLSAAMAAARCAPNRGGWLGRWLLRALVARP